MAGKSPGLCPQYEQPPRRAILKETANGELSTGISICTAESSAESIWISTFSVGGSGGSHVDVLLI
jgi:hypothetical protein